MNRSNSSLFAGTLADPRIDHDRMDCAAELDALEDLNVPVDITSIEGVHAITEGDREDAFLELGYTMTPYQRRKLEGSPSHQGMKVTHKIRKFRS